MTFHVPLPPSTNNLFVNRAQGGRAKTEAYKTWIVRAGWAIKAQNAGQFIHYDKPGLCVEILAPLPRRRDLDNIAKPILDLLVKTNILADDKLVDDLRLVRCPTANNAVSVTIWLG